MGVVMGWPQKWDLFGFDLCTTGFWSGSLTETNFLIKTVLVLAVPKTLG